MKKEFISYTVVRNNAIKLSHRVYREGFIPDVIYVSLRGGAYMGNVMSEFFKLLNARNGRKIVYYAAVVARSYIDVKKNENVKVDGWTYSPEYLRQGDRVLLVDDIFDTGRTINHLVEIIVEKGVPRRDVRIAVHDYKVRTYKSDQLPVQPDYYCRSHTIESPDDDFWIHYMSHELVGLTSQERATYYLSEDPKLNEAFKIFDE